MVCVICLNPLCLAVLEEQCFQFLLGNGQLSKYVYQLNELESQMAEYGNIVKPGIKEDCKIILKVNDQSEIRNAETENLRTL